MQLGKIKETFNKRLHIYLVLSIFGFIIHFIFKQLGSDIHKYNGIYSLGFFPNIHVVFERRLLIWFKGKPNKQHAFGWVMHIRVELVVRE